MSLRLLQLPLKVLLTCFLLTMGVGYLFAVAYLYLSSIQPHAEGGLVNAIVVKYHGSGQGTRLEAALGGSMREYVNEQERAAIIRWLHEGAQEADYGRVEPIFSKACASCHSTEAGTGLPPLTSYREVREFTRMDLGQSLKALARVSHVHLFGMSFIFAFTGAIFAFTATPTALKALLLAVPFLAIWVDIGSWWVTKYQPLFAYTVIIGGVLMALSLALQILLSLYDLWLRSAGRSKSQPNANGATDVSPREMQN